MLQLPRENIVAMFGHEGITEDDIQSLYKKECTDNVLKSSLGVFAVIDNESDKSLGFYVLKEVPSDKSTIETAIRLDKSARGKGVFENTVQDYLLMAFNKNPGMKRALCRSIHDSVRIIMSEECGMKEIAKHRENGSKVSYLTVNRGDFINLMHYFGKINHQNSTKGHRPSL